jgi:hypothetical protein
MECKECVDCKFYKYDKNVAHQIRCTKGGKDQPAIAVRADPKKCGPMGGGWRPKSA